VHAKRGFDSFAITLRRPKGVTTFLDQGASFGT
jgi:hypothetical protein